MATLKEHQAAMVDLLASGSGIPASASRLAHAMHDVLSVLVTQEWKDFINLKTIPALRDDATTPGLNDKALSKPQKALKTDSPAKWPTPAENRVKELTNTVGQLRAQVAKQRKEIAFLKMERNNAVAQLSEQAGCRKPDTQVCEHDYQVGSGGFYWCTKCGEAKQ